MLDCCLLPQTDLMIGSIHLLWPGATFTMFQDLFWNSDLEGHPDQMLCLSACILCAMTHYGQGCWSVDEHHIFYKWDRPTRGIPVASVAHHHHRLDKGVTASACPRGYRHSGNHHEIMGSMPVETIYCKWPALWPFWTGLPDGKSRKVPTIGQHLVTYRLQRR